MGGHVNLRFFGRKSGRDPYGSGFDYRHLREGGLDTKASSHILKSVEELRR